MNLHDFARMKTEKRRISMITAYDYSAARIAATSPIDCVLVGDSVAMTMHGFPSTVHADTPMLALHARAVARGLGESGKFLVVDMPFLSFRKGREAALECVGELCRAGAQAVKLEGVWGHEDVVEAIVRSGVPVMGHIGLTPQSIHGLGGFKVQGRDDAAAADLFAQAGRLEALGCFAIVLECVPAPLAARITAALRIPTIGIGAGAACDGQVLVWQDLLGMNLDFKPRFVKRFTEGDAAMREALDRYHREVVEGAFPGEKESYR